MSKVQSKSEVFCVLEKRPEMVWLTEEEVSPETVGAGLQWEIAAADPVQVLDGKLEVPAELEIVIDALTAVLLVCAGDSAEFAHYGNWVQYLPPKPSTANIAHCISVPRVLSSVQGDEFTSMNRVVNTTLTEAAWNATVPDACGLGA